MAEYDVVLTDVCKTYPGDTRAVINFNAEIERGSFVAMLGPSGCGKTTTLRMIGGLEEVTSGKIYLGGKDVTDLPPSQRDTSMMFQSFALFPHRTVLENIEFSLKMRGIDRGERFRQSSDMIDLIGLTELAQRYPRDLSGGQRQRVALGRALISRPTVLLLDEPLGSLDYSLRQAMMVELKKIQQEIGITFIMVTHSQQEALSMADSVIVMSDAVIQQTGTSREIYTTPKTRFVAEFIGNNNLFEGHLRSISGSIALIDQGESMLYVNIANVNSNHSIGSKVSVSIRADRMVTGEHPDMGNRVEATYIATEYLGSLETDVFEYAPNHYIQVEQHRESTIRDYKVGDRETICWPATAAVLLE